MDIIFVTGTAGAGKSLLTSALKRWYVNRGENAIAVNLDPGVVNLPYEPDVDVRLRVNLHDVMEDYGLGPNGALILAADLMATKLPELQEEVDSFKAEYVIIDTPGQTELFAFRESGEYIVKEHPEDFGPDEKGHSQGWRQEDNGMEQGHEGFPGCAIGHQGQRPVFSVLGALQDTEDSCVRGRPVSCLIGYPRWVRGPCGRTREVWQERGRIYRLSSARKLCTSFAQLSGFSRGTKCPASLMKGADESEIFAAR